jgi:hypothetical protein
MKPSGMLVVDEGNAALLVVSIGKQGLFTALPFRASHGGCENAYPGSYNEGCVLSQSSLPWLVAESYGVIPW